MADPDHEREFVHHVGGSARRRIASRRAGRSVLSWFGAFGVIGWSVALPTVAGIALGVWLDERLTGSTSWTLTLMVAGLAAGIWIAWGWVRREGRGDASDHGGASDRGDASDRGEDQEVDR